MQTKLLAALAALATITTGTPAIAEHHMAGENEAMHNVLADQRRADDMARDQYRHPAETLAFFKVEPGMTVADYMPAGGWYTRILVPYLGEEGRYIGLNPDPASSSNERMRDYFANLPKNFTDNVGNWGLSGAPYMVAGSQDEALTPYKGQVDRVLIFREMHNLFRSGALHTELTRIHDLLADDGMLGIVQHRAKADAPAAYTDGSKGYMREKDIIGLVEAHGFELVEKSEINANPNDAANWEAGVWTLPPAYRGTEEGDTAGRAEMDTIGESDRMTLLFRKRA